MRKPSAIWGVVCRDHAIAKLCPVLALVLACGDGGSKGAASTGGEEGGGDDGAETEGGDMDTGVTPEDLPMPDTDTDTGTTPPPSACDPFAQDCPEGEKCVPYVSMGDTWDANKCVAVTGDNTVGDSCVYDGGVLGTDDCDAASICWNTQIVDNQQIGTCLPFCGGTSASPECDPGTTCLIVNDGTINVCVPACDPLLQDCAPGLGCYWSNDGFKCTATTQDIPAGEPCGYINDCAKGNVCLLASALPTCAGTACCAPFCELGGEACELDGTECVAFFEENEAPPGLEMVGVCTVPG